MKFLSSNYHTNLILPKTSKETICKYLFGEREGNLQDEIKYMLDNLELDLNVLVYNKSIICVQLSNQKK